MLINWVWGYFFKAKLTTRNPKYSQQWLQNDQFLIKSKPQTEPKLIKITQLCELTICKLNYKKHLSLQKHFAATVHSVRTTVKREHVNTSLSYQPGDIWINEVVLWPKIYYWQCDLELRPQGEEHNMAQRTVTLCDNFWINLKTCQIWKLVTKIKFVIKTPTSLRVLNSDESY